MFMDHDGPKCSALVRLNLMLKLQEFIITPKKEGKIRSNNHF